MFRRVTVSLATYVVWLIVACYFTASVIDLIHEPALLQFWRLVWAAIIMWCINDIVRWQSKRLFEMLF